MTFNDLRYELLLHFSTIAALLWGVSIVVTVKVTMYILRNRYGISAVNSLRYRLRDERTRHRKIEEIQASKLATYRNLAIGNLTKEMFAFADREVKAQRHAQKLNRVSKYYTLNVPIQSAQGGINAHL